MKTKRILAVLLACVLVAVSCFAVTAAPSMDSSLVKTTYYDWEYFNPQGLVVMDGATPVTYSADNEDFVFIPSIDELLTVETESVRVIYKNEDIGKISVTVGHSFGDIENFGKQGHGHRCKGCGVIDAVEEHTAKCIIDSNGELKEDWIPNDDGGFFVQQTETAICSVCEGEMTRYIEGSEKFSSIFDFGNMTDTELEIVGYIYQILVSLIQTLVSF